jgi:hypothetical protein
MHAGRQRQGLEHVQMWCGRVWGQEHLEPCNRRMHEQLQRDIKSITNLCG